MDRIDAMATLIAAIDGGSLSAASRALGTPLATVSRKVSELEAHLRTQLVIRTSRRLELTEAGRAYVAAARRILADLDDAERQAAGEYTAPRGHLTITAPIMFGRLHVAPTLLDFLGSHTEITARLVLVDHVVNLIEEHVDVALRIGRLEDSAMRAIRLGEVRWVSCASPGYLASRGEPEDLEALNQHDCVMFEGQHAAQSWSFGAGEAARSVAIRPRLAVNTADAAIAAAIAGAGITRVLSYQIAEALTDGRLRLILRRFEPEPLPVHLLHGAAALLPLKLRAFLDFAAPRLRARLKDAAV